MTGHTFIETTIVVCMHAVALAMLMSLWRLLRGPPCRTASWRWTRSPSPPLPS